MIKTCKQCGKTFKADQHKRILCSIACRAEWKRVYVDIPCKFCGKDFLPDKPTNIYCSVRCRWDDKKDRYAMTCIRCGEGFEVQKSRLHTAKFCSHKCSHDAQRKERKTPKINHKKARCPKTNKIKKLHRIVMEQALCRELTRKEVVHHINGDHFDNRIQNLCIMSRGGHTLLHNEIKYGKKEN